MFSSLDVSFFFFRFKGFVTQLLIPDTFQFISVCTFTLINVYSNQQYILNFVDYMYSCASTHYRRAVPYSIKARVKEGEKGDDIETCRG